MRKVWVECAEVERYIMHELGEGDFGIDINLNDEEYAELVATNKVSQQLQEKLKKLRDERY